MRMFGKRLSALLLVMAITTLGIAMLPQGSDASARERQRPFTSEQRGSEWQTFRGRFLRERSHTDPQPSAVTPTPTATAPDPEQAQESTSTQTGAATLEAMEVEVFNLINSHRQQNGLPALANNSTLNVSSHNHSLDMAQEGYFSHTNLEGLSPFDRMEAAGYSCGTMGENIAAGQTTAQQVFEAWKNSPGHNANMLNSHYTVVGIGLVNVPDSSYGYYWTNNFGGC